jgi:surface polysaccharide O-acyltransferase-like enzyme
VAADDEPAVDQMVKPERRRDLDLMRTLVVVGLVFFHSARVFDTGEFYVKNHPPSEFVDVFIGIASAWGMPLLFVISGMGIWYSLRSRTTGAFARERLRRLLVPLVFGVLVIVPPQVWTELRGNSVYNKSYLEFLPDFLDFDVTLRGFPFVIGDSPPQRLFEPAHLWFLVLLFAFSLMLLPLIWYLRRPSGLRLIERLTQHLDHIWLIVIAGVPLAVLDAGLSEEVGLAGWNRYSYGVLILYGYLVASDREFGVAIRQHRRTALVGGSLAFGVVAALILGSGRDVGELMVEYDLASVVMRAAKAFSGWLWVVAILGFAGGSGKRRPASSEKVSKPMMMDRVGAYLSEAVLPIYVLHQTVIVLLAFYIVEWQVNALLKYLALVSISLVTIIVIYDLAVRRTPATRFLFGMKPSRRAPSTRPNLEGGASGLAPGQ